MRRLALLVLSCHADGALLAGQQKEMKRLDQSVFGLNVVSAFFDNHRKKILDIKIGLVKVQALMGWWSDEKENIANPQMNRRRLYFRGRLNDGLFLNSHPFFRAK